MNHKKICLPSGKITLPPHIGLAHCQMNSRENSMGRENA